MPHAIPALSAFLDNLILSPLNNCIAFSCLTINRRVFEKLVNLEGSSCILVLIVSKGAVTAVARLADEMALNALIVVDVYVVKLPVESCWIIASGSILGIKTFDFSYSRTYSPE